MRRSPAPTQSPADHLLRLLGDLPYGKIIAVVDTVLAEKDFSQFVRQAWGVVEPGRLLQWNWHLQATCDHLQAVYNFTVPEGVDPESSRSRKKIQRLIDNKPPRCSKSLIASVFFNAWVWTRWPGARFLCVTYADNLAQRDSLKTRQLVESEWYQSRWPEVSLSEDQKSKSRFNTNAGGFRVSTTVLGIATGEGGDFRIIDDPHNVKKALSDVERQQANTFFDLTLPTRVVDPKKSSTVICMQRLHEDDMTGHALSGDNPWDVLCVPMEYDGENRCRTALGFVDPRREVGELLHPARWDRTAVDEAKRDLMIQWGDFGVNSQFQQRPTPKGGGMFQTGNLIPVPAWPKLHELDRIVRYWDKAATEGGTGAETAGVLMAKNRITQRTIILDVAHGRWETNKREQEIQMTSHQDLRRLGLMGGNSGLYAVRVEQEPGSGGKDSARWTVRGLAGFNVAAIPKRTNKQADWEPLASQVNSGGVEMVEGPWNQEVRSQMASAPYGKLVDILDAAAGGFKHIWLGPRAGVIA